MLVIGITDTHQPHSKNIDIDLDAISPQKLHDILKKEFGTIFETIICVEDDEVVGTYSDDDDFDSSDSSAQDSDLDEDVDFSSLRDEDENDVDDVLDEIDE